MSLLNEARRKLAKRRQGGGKKKKQAKRKVKSSIARTSTYSPPRVTHPLRDIHANNIPNSKKAKAATETKILDALSKLSDVDTRAVGARIVSNIISTIPNNSLHILLSCLYHINSDAKPLCRREYILLLGEVVRVHGMYCEKFLSKIINNLTKRCQDNDSRVRKACAEAFCDVVTCALPEHKFDEYVCLIFNGLFKVFSRADSQAKCGAGESLESVITHLGKETSFYVSSIAPRLLNTWATNQNKPQIYQLSSTRALIENSGIHISPWLAEFIVIFVECGKNKDWSVRENVALCIQTLAEKLKPIQDKEIQKILADAYGEMHGLLEKLKFDKVINVRNTANKALKAWTKTVIIPPVPISLPEIDSSKEDYSSPPQEEQQHHRQHHHHHRPAVTAGLSKHHRPSSTTLGSQNHNKKYGLKNPPLSTTSTASPNPWFHAPSENSEQLLEKTKQNLGINEFQTCRGKPQRLGDEFLVHKYMPPSPQVENWMEKFSKQQENIVKMLQKLETKTTSQLEYLNSRVNSIEQKLSHNNNNPTIQQQQQVNSILNSENQQHHSSSTSQIINNNNNDFYHPPSKTSHPPTISLPPHHPTNSLPPPPISLSEASAASEFNHQLLHQNNTSSFFNNHDHQSHPSSNMIEIENTNNILLPHNLDLEEHDEERILDATQEIDSSSTIEENDLWKNIWLCLDQNDVNAAYHTALYASDDLTFVRLIMETGPIFALLEPNCICALLYRIMQMIRAESFLQNVIPFLHDSFNILQNNLPSLPLELKLELVDSLRVSRVDEAITHLLPFIIQCVDKSPLPQD